MMQSFQAGAPPKTILCLLLLLLLVSSWAPVLGFLSAPRSARFLPHGGDALSSSLPLYHCRQVRTTTLFHGSVSDEHEFLLVTPDSDILELTEGQRLVCVGDVHGDVQALRRLLRVAGVVSTDNHQDDVDSVQWTGGNTILVQTGDILDRGNDELACWRTMARLSQQAHEQGGAVIVLWGNHEALNCDLQFHYTTGEKEYQEMVKSLAKDDEESNRNHNNAQTDEPLSETIEMFDFFSTGPPRHQPARKLTYEPRTGLLVQPLLSRLKVVVKVGKTLCVHAGLTAQHLDSFGGIRGMNREVRDWIQTGGTGVNQGRLPQYLVGAKGPVWMRDFSYPADVEPIDPSVQDKLDAALFVAGADRMVVGHTVQTKGINAALKGKVWRIDVGASRGVASGSPEVLQIQMNNAKEVVSVLTETHGELTSTTRQAQSAALRNATMA